MPSKVLLVYGALTVLLGVEYLTAFPIDEEKPCAAREIPGQSVICVCNATYCDELTRIPPAGDDYMIYTSSIAGLRYKKNKQKLQLSSIQTNSDATLILDPCEKYQRIYGFGSAITDSAGINWKSLPETQRQFLVDSCFGDKGNGYSHLRLPIGGTDFSTHIYSYNETPEDDLELSNFTLSFDDLEYKIPMIKACMKASKTPIHILSSCWGAPDWMKEISPYTVCGPLKMEYLRTFAQYKIKFIELYEAQGIPIWAVSTTNEPSEALLPLRKFNCVGWTANRMGIYISKHLGPLLRASKFNSVKIIGLDDQRYHIPLWFSEMLEDHPDALQYIDGLGLHWYGNAFTPPEILQFVTQKYPKIFLMGTEACEGAMIWQSEKVDLGSWERAESYIIDILVNLNYNVSGWVDWNICLNEQGGPTWNGNNVDSQIIVAAEKGEFYKQPMFYALGHFAKFMTRDSFRIKVTDNSNGTWMGIKHVAAITPDDTIVVVIYNYDTHTKTISIQLEDKQAVVEMEGRSIATVEIQSQDRCRYVKPSSEDAPMFTP